MFSTSEDGVRWERLHPVEISGVAPGEEKGWLFWRPKTRDGVTGYVPAYWRDHGRSILLATARLEITPDALFAHGGRVYAVARWQPPPFRRGTWQASPFARKRTALYLVEPDRLVHLSDVPSAGDTAYAGVVLREGQLWFSYYTSDVRRDGPWLLGMFLRSEIRMGRVSLERLEALALAKAGEARR